MLAFGFDRIGLNEIVLAAPPSAPNRSGGDSWRIGTSITARRNGARSTGRRATCQALGNGTFGRELLVLVTLTAPIGAMNVTRTEAHVLPGPERYHQRAARRGDLARRKKFLAETPLDVTGARYSYVAVIHFPLCTASGGSGGCGAR